MVIISARPYFVYSYPGYARRSLMPFTVENFAEKTNESRMTHLTNLAIQKKHSDFKSLKNKVTMSVNELVDYLIQSGIIKTAQEYYEKVDEKINEVMRLMFLQMKEKLDRKFGCFEVFGFDFMLDSNLNPYLLEVNINPALFLDTPVLEEMLPKLISDTCRFAAEIHKPYEKSA